VAGVRRVRGFTLVELMVTCGILAILAAIAVPSYTVYVKKSRRGDAEAALMDIAQREQQYLLDARAYAPDLVSLGTAVPAEITAYYAIAINAPAGAPPTFTVSATPIAGSPQAGDYTLTLDNTGLKSPSSAW
jgi:type IV pilus assembly protein PilE